MGVYVELLQQRAGTVDEELALIKIDRLIKYSKKYSHAQIKRELGDVKQILEDTLLEKRNI